MESTAIHLKRQMSDHDLAILNSEMEKHKKSTGLAYVLWFFLGHLGIHKFYLGKIKSGILYILLGIGFWISLVGSFFSAVLVGAAAEEGMKEVSSAAGTGMGVSFILALVCGGVLGILILIDLFTIPKQIRKSYEAKELTVINRIASPANP